MANELAGRIRALLTDRATPEAWLRIVALLSDAAAGDAQRARAAVQQQVAGWGPTAPTPSVVGTWKVKRATYFAGELEAADAIDWSAPWQRIDLDDADGFPTGFLKWGPSEHLQYYLTVFADGRYVDADLRRGPLTFEDLTPQFDIDEEEQAAWHARAESFPVGAVTAWLRRVADATYPADSTIFDAVTKEGILSASQALLHQATDEDEFWQRDIIRLNGPNTLVRSAYTTYQWVHFETLRVEYERL